VELKLSLIVDSSHRLRFLKDGTGELKVSDRADCNFIALINLDDCVTPATKMPIIKITIYNSIKEKALLFINLII
jgi:hypothetical protein